MGAGIGIYSRWFLFFVIDAWVSSWGRSIDIPEIGVGVGCTRTEILLILGGGEADCCVRFNIKIYFRCSFFFCNCCLVVE